MQRRRKAGEVESLVLVDEWGGWGVGVKWGVGGGRGVEEMEGGEGLLVGVVRAGEEEVREEEEVSRSSSASVGSGGDGEGL